MRDDPAVEALGVEPSPASTGWVLVERSDTNVGMHCTACDSRIDFATSLDALYVVRLFLFVHEHPDGVPRRSLADQLADGSPVAVMANEVRAQLRATLLPPVVDQRTPSADLGAGSWPRTADGGRRHGAHAAP